MRVKVKFFIFLFFFVYVASVSKAEDKIVGTASGMNIKIGAEYVGINSIESKYLAYTKVKEAEKTLYRLKQSTRTNEFFRKTTAEQREEIDKKIKELEGILSAVNEDNVNDKDYAKIHVKLQSIVDEINMIDNISDFTYGFAPKFILKTGILASGKYAFITPVILDFNLYYQLNKIVNPFVGFSFSVPILLNHRNGVLANGYNVSTYAILLEGRFGNLFKLHKDHYVSLFFKIGGLLGHRSMTLESVTTNGSRTDTASETILTRTTPLGESVVTGLGLEYFFKNKLVVGVNFDIYNASDDSPITRRTNFVFGFNIGYNFCSGNKSYFSTNSSGKTNVYKTIWE